MVFAIQCPNPKCRKFMLVEDEQRNKVVPCLLCKEPIKIGGGAGTKAPANALSGPPKLT
jgi:hypothetical protein